MRRSHVVNRWNPQVGAKIEGDDHPPSQPFIDLLTETFRNQAARGELRAAGLCSDVLTIPPEEHQKRDAVCFGLKHYLGQTMDVFIPYVRNRTAVCSAVKTSLQRQQPSSSANCQLWRIITRYVSLG
jgi:hypothetical protein